VAGIRYFVFRCSYVTTLCFGVCTSLAAITVRAWHSADRLCQQSVAKCASSYFLVNCEIRRRYFGSVMN